MKKFLKEHNCWTLKTWSNGVQRSGVPDLLICCECYFIGVELKATNGKPSELQIYNLKQIRESGGYSILLYPEDYEVFKDFITSIKYGDMRDANNLYNSLSEKLQKYM